jgi:hypothetical protein
MSKCIYCGSADLTLEHPLPRCLGNFKDYVPLKDRICKSCNSIFSQLDEQLCRSGMEAFFRKYLGIAGRAEHKPVNPFYRGSSRGGRLEMSGIDHESGEATELELTGPTAVRELRRVKLVAEDDSTHIIPIPDGMTPGEFRKKVDSLGIKFFKHAFLSADPDEIPWVESLFEGFKMEGRSEWSQPTGPKVYGPLVIKFTVTERYFRAMAKIGFHYFLTKFPRYRGDEACFSEIRDFILNGCSIDEISRFVTNSQKQFVYQLREGARLNSWGHLIAVEANYTRFQAKVQLFVGPQNRSSVFTTHLGKNPSPIHYTEAHGSFFAYYPPEERGEFDGEVSDLSSASPAW